MAHILIMLNWHMLYAMKLNKQTSDINEDQASFQLPCTYMSLTLLPVYGPSSQLRRQRPQRAATPAGPSSAKENPIKKLNFMPRYAKTK